MKQTQIAIIGAGSVGTATAYNLILINIVSEIILVDCNTKKCQAEVDDLADTLPWSTTRSIRTGNYKEAAQADIIIICAGKPQQPGQSRADLVTDNAKIIRSIFNEMGPISKDSIIIMVTNPVDTLTQLAQNLSGLPTNQVIGSGTLLDTIRWRGFISKEITTGEQSIEAYVIGEHGENQVALISSANIEGVPLDEYPKLGNKKLEELAKKAKLKVYGLVENKGCAEFGVAACVTALCKCIIFNENLVTPVVTYSKEYKTCMSLPVNLGAKGIFEQVYIATNEKEQQALQESAEQLRKMYKSIQ
ncbi:MAG TPA: lactate/malate dehydrogenase family protein [Candidatus Babeliales bacterium]|nr:lactate/malate dehydrogenase family protein [Candidatus Babeliales bacterium]